MSRASIVAACGGLLLQSAAAAVAGPFDPIVIDHCRISNTRSYVSSYKPIELIFTNRQATAADEIHFTVEYAGRVEHIIDRGTFSQGVKVDHAFNGFYGAPYSESRPRCGIDCARFRDGSVWGPAGPSFVPKCPPN